MTAQHARDGQHAVGVVGAGRIATLNHLPILASRRDTTLAFVADIDGDRARIAGRTYGCPAVVEENPTALPNCDAAILAIPAGERAPYVEAFARRGTPVLVEKPFAADLDTHRRFLEHDRLACNYMRQNFSSLRQCRELARSDVFGDLTRIELRESAKLGAVGLVGEHYQTDPHAPGAGVLLERGCHLLSQLVALVPADTVSVVDASLDRTAGVVTDAAATMRPAAGSPDIDFRVSAARNVRDELRLVFDRATVTACGADRVTIEPAGTAASFSLVPSDCWATTVVEAMDLRWGQFLDVAFGSATVDVAAETGLSVSRLIDEIREAAAGVAG